MFLSVYIYVFMSTVKQSVYNLLGYLLNANITKCKRRYKRILKILSHLVFLRTYSVNTKQVCR